MAERKYFCLCESNCKFETMTKEQILTAITQAVESGEVKDVDTGFVQTIKTINGQPLKFFVGSQYEYEQLSDTERENVFAIISNDTNMESIIEVVVGLEGAVSGMEWSLMKLRTDLEDGTCVPQKAKSAEETSFTSGEWTSFNPSNHSFEEGKTYQVKMTWNGDACQFLFTVDIPSLAGSRLYLPRVFKNSTNNGYLQCYIYKSAGKNKLGGEVYDGTGTANMTSANCANFYLREIR